MCFVGNDINDLDVLKKVGLPVAACDSHSDLKVENFYFTNAHGGNGVVRELCDYFNENYES